MKLAEASFMAGEREDLHRYCQMVTVTQTMKDAPEVPKNADAPDVDGMGAAVAAAVIVALLESILLFRAWVVASEKEVVGANIFFFFLGVLPWFGIVASARRKLWGPRLVVSSALIATTGLFFTRNGDWQGLLIASCIMFIPTIGVGLLLNRCLQKTVAR